MLAADKDSDLMNILCVIHFTRGGEGFIGGKRTSAG